MDIWVQKEHCLSLIMITYECMNSDEGLKLSLFTVVTTPSLWQWLQNILFPVHYLLRIVVAVSSGFEFQDEQQTRKCFISKLKSFESQHNRPWWRVEENFDVFPTSTLPQSWPPFFLSGWPRSQVMIVMISFEQILYRAMCSLELIQSFVIDENFTSWLGAHDGSSMSTDLWV